MKVKDISLPYIFQVLYVLCFTCERLQDHWSSGYKEYHENNLTDSNKVLQVLAIRTLLPLCNAYVGSKSIFV